VANAPAKSRLTHLVPLSGPKSRAASILATIASTDRAIREGRSTIIAGLVQ
jgi:hypothetical protein